MTDSGYLKRIQAVCRYIDTHIEETLELETLCDVAHFSKYHFHRLFSAYMGVSLYQYVQQIRLKRATYQLVFRPEMSITDIALDAQFDYTESFSRAFKKRFTQSPSEFRQKPDWLTWHQNYHRIEYRQECAMQVRMVDFPTTQIAVLEHKGSPKKVMDSASQFIAWRKETGLSPITNSKTFGIAYHDPNNVPEDVFRFDIAGEIQEPVPENAYGVINKQLSGGRYVVARHFGSYDQIGDTIYALYRQWLPESGEELRDAPCFFHYLNFFPDVAEHALETDVYLPLV